MYRRQKTQLLRPLT